MIRRTIKESAGKTFFSAQPRRTLCLGGGILLKNELPAEPPSTQRRRRVLFPTDAKGVDFLITRPAHFQVGSLSILWLLASGLDHYATVATSTILTFALSLETGALKVKTGETSEQ